MIGFETAAISSRLRRRTTLTSSDRNYRHLALALIDFLIHGQETNLWLLGSSSRWSFRNYPLRLRIRQLITSIVSVFLTMQLSILIALPFPQCRFPSPRGRRINLFSPRPQIRDNAGGRQDEDGGFLERNYEKLDRSGGRPQRGRPRRAGHGVATRKSGVEN